MADTRNSDELVVSYRFLLRVEGAFDVAIKGIRPFAKENEYEYIQEGGLNDYVHFKRKAITKPFTLQLERYVPTDFYDPLPNGTELLLPLLLFCGKNNGKSFSFSNLSRVYMFTGCEVMNKEVGPFDAEKSGLLTEIITIGYHQNFALDLSLFSGGTG